METSLDERIQGQPTSGKRKRSSTITSDSYSTQRRTSPDLEIEQSRLAHNGMSYVALKRSRIKSVFPNDGHTAGSPPIAELAKCFPLAPFPVELLQHIMSYLDPFSLGRLMSVNRYLHGVLDSRSPPALAPGMTKLDVLSAESIWSRSRRAHLPGVPHPLQSVTELDMLKLMYGRHCQKCGMFPRPSTTAFSVTPWNSGPGPTGVRAIWPFKVRLCAECLRSLLIKETDLTDPGYSELRIGLLPAVFTPSLHYVMSITLTHTSPPSGLKLEKYFYRPAVEHLIQNTPHRQDPSYPKELERLDSLRQDAATDVMRFEAWELSKNPYSGSLNAHHKNGGRSSASGSSIPSDSITRSHFTNSSSGNRPQLSSRSGLGTSLISSSVMRHDLMALNLAPHNELLTAEQIAASNVNSIQQGMKTSDKHSDFTPRSQQGSEQVKRLKAEKQVEILQRCMRLDPPILPPDLDRLPAYNLALQDLMPLNDGSWELLKKRLLQQRQAQELHVDRDQGTPPSSHVVDSESLLRSITPPAEPVQIDLRKQAVRPVRDKLSDFAREYIHRRYADGFGQNQSTAPQFAADVLIYVRKRFYENQRQEDDYFLAAREPVPREPASGIWTRVLKLEHMRFVFETSIKPYTDPVRKDLFLCRACDTHGRYFGFEAIIQHYASKHTDTFSLGQAVVYWKTEWPAEPPFETLPGRDSDATENVSQARSVPRALQQQDIKFGHHGPASVKNNDNLLSQAQGSVHAPASQPTVTYLGGVIDTEQPRLGYTVPAGSYHMNNDQHRVCEEPPTQQPPYSYDTDRSVLIGHLHNREAIYQSSHMSSGYLYEPSRDTVEYDRSQLVRYGQSSTSHTRLPIHNAENLTRRTLAEIRYDGNNSAEDSGLLHQERASEPPMIRPPPRNRSRPHESVHDQQSHGPRRSHTEIADTPTPEARDSINEDTSPSPQGHLRTAARQFLDSFDPAAGGGYHAQGSRSLSDGSRSRMHFGGQFVGRDFVSDGNPSISQLPRQPELLEETPHARRSTGVDVLAPHLRYREVSHDIEYDNSDASRPVNSRSYHHSMIPSRVEGRYSRQFVPLEIQGDAVSHPDPPVRRLVSRPPQHALLLGHQVEHNANESRYFSSDRGSDIVRRETSNIQGEHSIVHLNNGIRYRQEDLVWDPETRRYYIERPTMERNPSTRELERGDLPPRNANYQYAYKHYSQPQYRTTTDDPDYDRP